MAESQMKTVLVIDDEKSIGDLIIISLEDEFNVLYACDGQEGIKMAKKHKPDVILMDIRMPIINGFMTSKVIKRNIAIKHIPIIFLSGEKTKESFYAAIQAGGSDYIVKPFSTSDLLTRIRRVTEK